MTQVETLLLSLAEVDLVIRLLSRLLAALCVSCFLWGEVIEVFSENSIGEISRSYR